MAEPDPPPLPLPQKVETGEPTFNQQPPPKASSITAQSQSDAVMPERTDANLNTTVATTMKRFSCFLSHYKHEAGTEARLVKNELKHHMKKDSFLDSGKFFLV